MSISAPAREASYSASITFSSVSELTFTRIRAFLPASAACETELIASTSLVRSVKGATSSLRNRCGRPNPVM